MSYINKNHLKPEIVGGHNITYIRSLFDQDDKNIIVPSYRSLFYYSADSCEQVGKTSITSLEADEIIVACERLDNCLYAFTNNGRIFIWSLEKLDWINELSLPLVEHDKLVSCKMLSKRQYIYSVFDSSKKVTTLYSSMSRSERERPKSREAIGECDSGEQITFDIGSIIPTSDYSYDTEASTGKASKQRCLAYIRGPYVYFQKLGIGEKFSATHIKQRVGQPNTFTCVRANPKKPMIAVGDTSGRIYLYTGDFINEKFNRTKLHWHILPVHDLSFSSTGNTLFSVGGESGCVVIWDLSPNNIGQKRVVARLGMPIRFINCGNSLNQSIISFEDNELQVMDTNEKTKQVKTFTRRTIDIFTKNDCKALRINPTQPKDCSIKSIGLLWHSSSDTVVTNSRTGSLQFYSPKEKSRIQSLNFLGSKILSLETAAKVVPSDITRAAISLDGDWLAFYETRDSDNSFPDVKLHIWKQSRATNRWAWLQTADRLHPSTSIVDLKFSPDGQFLVSVSGDGSFQLLHRICLESSKTSGKSKQMYAKGFVGHAPEKLPAMATFSQDSSVMAMSLKNDTTLIWTIVDPFKLVYETQLNQIGTEGGSNHTNRDDLTHPQSHDVLGLHFGYHNTSQSLAPLCEIRTNSIKIWNILNSQETMEYSASPSSKSQVDGHNHIEFTAAAFDQCPGDSRSLDHFAVATKKNSILIFRIQITSTPGTLSPLIIIDATLPSMNSTTPSYYTQMCFLANPILDIDPQCHNDSQLLNLLNRLCLMNNCQELISITDQLTIERQSASNNCNAVKTTDINGLQAYFAQSAITYNEETNDLVSKGQLDSATITEKQRKIRNRLGVQKMLRDLLTRIPSHNLPQMDILGPMILDKLI